MNIENRTALVTGASRGIGQALVKEALRRGAKKVYAASRGTLQNTDKRVVPMTLDVTSDLQAIQRTAEGVEILDLLINNAGIARYEDLSDLEEIERHLAVNLFGTFKVSRAFLPHLKRSNGAIINILSVMALAPFPITPAYAISKAAEFSMTQSQRAILAGQGVTVHGAILGPVDTDMTRGFELPKASPESVAMGIFDGLEKGEDDIFPDSLSQSIKEAWRTGVAKTFELQWAGFVPESATKVA